VKGSVRYGREGNFNQSPDKRRHGTNPKNAAENIFALSTLLAGKITFSSLDYTQIFHLAEPGDLLYMDPPYQPETTDIFPAWNLMNSQTP
jgi:DNA adenine methylase